jgi:hypothetical protein
MSVDCVMINVERETQSGALASTPPSPDRDVNNTATGYRVAARVPRVEVVQVQVGDLVGVGNGDGQSTIEPHTGSLFGHLSLSSCSVSSIDPAASIAHTA